MKTKSLFLFGFLCAYLFISSCKTQDQVKPNLSSNDINHASIATLTTYLSKTLAVSENEISYQQNTHEFIIRNNIHMKENDVQNHYSHANEYKARNKQAISNL